MSLPPWLLLFHIVGAMIWVGGGLMLSLIGGRARRSEDPHIIGEFTRTLSYVGLRVLMPAVLAVVLTGVWLVLAGQGWSFTQEWILLGIAAFVATFLIGGVYMSRVAIQLERIANQPDSDRLAILNLLRRWIFGYRIILFILLFAVWDMVFKPGI